MTNVNVASKLVYKWVASYFMKQDETRVTRLDADFLIANGNCMVKGPNHPDLFAFEVFPQEWQRATYKGKAAPEAGGPDAAALWTRFEGLPVVQPLTLTDELIEWPGSRNKPGTFYRRFRYDDTRFILGDARYFGTVFLDKKFCDMLNPDLDGLQGFLFELLDGYGGVVRVSAVYGHIAYIMPADMKKPGRFR